jgi:rubredoxin
MPDAPPVAAGPLWESIPHDVLCPLCEYNLRGLSEPRCPECGYRFDWADVVNPKIRVHPYLFEHHPERNIRSFFRTLCGTLRPIKFWNSLSPSQPSRPGRLFAYWVLTSLLACLVVAAQWVRSIVDGWNYSAWISYSPVSPFSSPPATPFSWSHVLDTALATWRGDTNFEIAWNLALFWIAWPWLTLLALSIFQVSMARAKIKTIHVVRCLFYSFDIGAWLGIFFAAAIVLSIWFPAIEIESTVGGILALGIITLMIIRLWAAYRWYLRFRHPFWTIVLSQIVAFLGAAAAMVVWDELTHTHKF